MPRKKKDFMAHVERVAGAWKKFFPEKTFSGFTLAQFLQEVDPCRVVRVELEGLARQTKMFLYRRRTLDRKLKPALLRVVHAVRGDPDVGDDSPMYSAMGYVPRSRRRPGRKRKRRVGEKSRASAASPK